MNLLSIQYDKYYKNGNLSIYNKRFGKIKVPTNDVRIIQQSFLKILTNSKNKKIKILDFGCGDGRYFEILKSLTKKTKKTIEIISYDISMVGLKYYMEKLIKDNFKYKSIKNIGSSCKTSSIIATFKKDNIIFKIAYGYEKDKLENIQKILGTKYDLVFCLFGVLSHIATQEERIKYLVIFKTILKKQGRLVLTVPGKGILKEELKCYSFLRKQGIPFMDATEEGDLYYKPQSSKENSICNYHHLYKIAELEYEIKKAEIHKIKSGILNIWFPTKLKNILFSKIDEYLTRIGTKILPKKIQSKGAYLFIEAIKE